MRMFNSPERAGTTVPLTLPPYTGDPPSCRTRHNTLLGSPGTEVPMPMLPFKYGRTSMWVEAPAAVTPRALIASTTQETANIRNFMHLLLPRRVNDAERPSPNRCRAGRDRDEPVTNGRRRR